MGALYDLIDECGKNNPVGVATMVHYVCQDDIDVFPPFITPVGAGDTLKLDGDIVLKAMKAWTRIKIVANSGEVKDTLVGAEGSKSIESTFDFMKSTTDPAVMEFFNNIKNGCGVCVVKELSGHYRVLGNLDTPCTLESMEAGTGKKSGDSRGATAQLKTTVGIPAPYYTGTFDIDPLT